MIFTNPEHKGMMGKHRSHDTLRPRPLLVAVYGYYDIFSKQSTEKLLIFTPTLPTAALNLIKA